MEALSRGRKCECLCEHQFTLTHYFISDRCLCHPHITIPIPSGTWRDAPGLLDALQRGICAGERVGSTGSHMYQAYDHVSFHTGMMVLSCV